MTGDPDAIGEDGTVRLRAYAKSADWLWFSCVCSGCSRAVPIGVRPAIALLGGEATVGELTTRLRCTGCGGRRVSGEQGELGRGGHGVVSGLARAMSS